MEELFFLKLQIFSSYKRLTSTVQFLLPVGFFLCVFSFCEV